MLGSTVWSVVALCSSKVTPLAQDYAAHYATMPLPFTMQGIPSARGNKLSSLGREFRIASNNILYYCYACSILYVEHTHNSLYDRIITLQ